MGFWRRETLGERRRHRGKGTAAVFTQWVLEAWPRGGPCPGHSPWSCLSNRVTLSLGTVRPVLCHGLSCTWAEGGLMGGKAGGGGVVRVRPEERRSDEAAAQGAEEGGL